MSVLVGLIEASWREYPAAMVMLLGVLQLWRGLHGGRNGVGGMLRRHAGAVGRIEGWRRAILGLSVVGLGAAWMWQSPLLLFLAIGIGFCEGQESSKILAAMQWDAERRVRGRNGSGAPIGKGRHRPEGTRCALQRKDRAVQHQS